MDHKLTPKPKLDRLNAGKNIDYHPSSSFSLDASTHRIRSLLLDPKASFRIKGIDGEFDLFCQTLGFSGPEDFAIPTAVWEAQKARRSCVHTPSPFTHSAPSDKPNVDTVRFQTEAKLSENEPDRNTIHFSNKREVEGEVSNSKIAYSFTHLNSGVSVRTVKDRGGGIKGDRPPILAPPPVMLLQPVVDHVSSTWDILNSFAPNDDEDSDYLNRGDREIEENKKGEDSDVDEEIERLNSNRVGENEILPEPSCSSQSNDDYSDGENGEHDTPGAIMQIVHCVSPNAKFRRNINSWQKGELLGSGSFGTVFEGYTDDGFFFAVKEVSLLDQGSQGKQSILQLEQEISLLRDFEHENIVRYLGTDKDGAKLYIFLELATKGSLARLYQKYHLRDSQVSAYTRQILNGLRYLHDRGVVHRDIKCANILVDANGSVKLADFGLAKATQSNDIKSCKGTAFWMAPEVVNLRNRTYGLAADIWSLGCSVLEMLTGRPPYSHLEGMQALFRIGRGEPPLVPDSLSKDAQDFIRKCLQVNPNDRPTAVQLLDHPFVKRPIQPFLIPPSPRFINSPEIF
ncbi:mitogen-activated protein kinase kinase kinase 1-like [Euphorbia lathyris]|uniref:mitogen-activated protein kinase kinase kinase 1-like n=1 Tax=Euphorbia lathyris TaxID=212925 RepID=UPI003313D578